jgi:hypothetical protein
VLRDGIATAKDIGAMDLDALVEAMAVPLRATLPKHHHHQHHHHQS